MTEIDIVKELKLKYNDLSLNEAETRFKIIDPIIKRVLKWPDDPIAVEFYINGNRADYILKGKNDRPLLVIESKRNEHYFELPSDINSSNTHQKILVEKLLTDDNIKEAIFQVKEYSEDLLAPFACISNGKSWIIFKVHSPLKPWKKLTAYVIRDLDFFIDNYTTAVNLLGYNSVVSENSLAQQIGAAKKAYQEIYFAKNNITAYNTKVNSNKYAGTLSVLSRKYLGIIPETDSEFMEHCYVSNKGMHDKLQKDVQGFLHDSLTPYYKNLGFREFTDDHKGGAFGIRIADIVKKENLDNVMILFGGRGSGKSTFLKRFLFHIKPREIINYSHIALVDLLNSPQTKEELSAEIWNRILEKIDFNKLRQGSRDQILDLFKEEFLVYERQILVGLNPESEEYQKLVRDFLLISLNDKKLIAEKISLLWKNKNKGLIIFLDNMDQLPPELQDVCFLTAEEVAKRLSCLVIVSMREERFFNAKTRGVLDAYHTSGFHLSAPVIPEVIIKRIYFILEKLKFTQDIDLEFGIKNTSELNTINSFFEICNNQLKQKTSPLSFFLRFATHGDVRQALEFFKGFLTSGYTNISEMAVHSDWVFQVHQVIKPMMIPDRFFYDEKLSKVPNLFQLRNDVESSHFTGLRILRFLHNRSGDKASSGFIDVKFFLQTLESKYGSKEDCIKHIDLYLQKGLIESSNRLECYTDEIDQIKISALGEYIYEHLAFNFAYIDLICLDCGTFDESLNNYLVKTANKELDHYFGHDFMSRIKLRIERVKKFVEYLISQENQECVDLGINDAEPKFTERLMDSITQQEKRIMKSAENKLVRIEAEYN